jgi:hypothetical protein
MFGGAFIQEGNRRPLNPFLPTFGPSCPQLLNAAQDVLNGFDLIDTGLGASDATPFATGSGQSRRTVPILPNQGCVFRLRGSWPGRCLSWRGNQDKEKRNTQILA